MAFVLTSAVRWTVPFAAIALLAVQPGGATPGSGFTPGPISVAKYGALQVQTDKTDKWDLFLKTKGDTDVGVDRLTVDAGGYSGWHAHATAIFVTVLQGEITWYDGNDPICAPRTYTAGESFIEQAYRVHNVKNNGSGQAIFTAVRIAPTGTPVRLDRDQPSCGQ